MHGRLGPWFFPTFHKPAKILPCHAARASPGLNSDRCGQIIRSPGSGKMTASTAIAAPDGCRSHARLRIREVDFGGGCRCQAFALTGDAANTDPACTLSPMHEQIFKQAEREAAAHQDRFLCRNFAGGTLETEGGGKSIMAPDADAGKSSPTRRSVCAADFGMAFSLGDDHEIYVESVHSAAPTAFQQSICTAAPAAAASPITAGCSIPNASTPYCSTSAAQAAAAREPARGANTLPHLIAGHGDDPPKIRLRAAG